MNQIYMASTGNDMYRLMPDISARQLETALYQGNDIVRTELTDYIVLSLSDEVNQSGKTKKQQEQDDKDNKKYQPKTDSHTTHWDSKKGKWVYFPEK